MPARLDFTKGRAAVLSVGETPWHREGVVLETPPSSISEVLKLAGLDFDVELTPLYHRGTSDSYAQINDFMAVRRTDVGKVLGVVGSRYTPLQNRDAFMILEPLLDKGVVAIETAGALREGRDIWILVRFNIQDPVVQEVFTDEVVPFGLLSNNHAGERQVVVQETPIRVVCANTLGLALSRTERRVGIRHTVNVEVKVVEAAKELWGAVIERYRGIAEQYKQLKATYLDEALFRELVLDTAAPIPPALQKSDLTRQAAAARNRWDARRARIAHLWTHGPEHRGDQSCWEAYNAVAQSLDHDQVLWPTRGTRTASLFDGRLGRIKQQTLNALAAHANGGR